LATLSTKYKKLKEKKSYTSDIEYTVVQVLCFGSSSIVFIVCFFNNRPRFFLF